MRHLRLLVALLAAQWLTTEAAADPINPPAVVRSPVAGGVARSLSDSIEVTSKLLGAKCDGVTDDTAAIQRINTAMNAGYTVRMEPGRCRTTATVVFDAVRGNLDAQGAIIAPDAPVLVGVQLGSASRILSSRITGLTVDRGAYDSTRETEGFRLVNVSNVSLVDLEARYARYNWRLRPGNGQLVSYVTLINPKAIYGRINFWVDMGEPGDGFATSITVLGGRLAGTVIGDPFNANTVENVRLDNKTGAVDMIRWFGTEMEGNQAYAIYNNAPSNMFVGLRLEGVYSVAAIYLGPDAWYNTITDMYPSTTVVDGGRFNRIELANETRLPGGLGVGLASRGPAGPLDVEADVDGLSRLSVVNRNAGAARRIDIKIGTGPGGAEALFLGVDQAGVGYKAYGDNRSGGPFALQASGTTTHTFGLDGSFRASGGFSVFNAPAVTTRPSLPGAATDAASTQTLANALRTVLINYGLAQ